MVWKIFQSQIVLFKRISSVSLSLIYTHSFCLSKIAFVNLFVHFPKEMKSSNRASHFKSTDCNHNLIWSKFYPFSFFPIQLHSSFVQRVHPIHSLSIIKMNRNRQNASVACLWYYIICSSEHFALLRPTGNVESFILCNSLFFPQSPHTLILYACASTWPYNRIQLYIYVNGWHRV